MILLSGIKRKQSSNDITKTRVETCAIFAAVYKQMWSNDRRHIPEHVIKAHIMKMYSKLTSEVAHY
jgi:hypothetical protein